VKFSFFFLRIRLRVCEREGWRKNTCWLLGSLFLSLSRGIWSWFLSNNYPLARPSCLHVLFFTQGTCTDHPKIEKPSKTDFLGWMRLECGRTAAARGQYVALYIECGRTDCLCVRILSENLLMSLCYSGTPNKEWYPYLVRIRYRYAPGTSPVRIGYARWRIGIF